MKFNNLDVDDKILIIGSGESASMKAMGEVIDNQFDYVVRFKGFEDGLGKYDKYVGTKTDALVCNTNKVALEDMVQKWNMGYWDRYNPLDLFFTVTGKVGIKRYNQLCDEIKENSVVIDYDRVDDHMKLFGDMSNRSVNIKRKLTSGFIVLSYFMRNTLSSISIYGFDAVYGYSSTGHYYSDFGSTIKKIHEIGKEATLIRQMINNGIIVKL